MTQLLRGGAVRAARAATSTAGPAATAGWRLAPGVRQLADHRLVGGTPFRVARLSPAGAEIIASLLGSTEQPEPGTPPAALAARLVRYGMLIAPPLAPVAVRDITVVIPARTSPERAGRLLAHIPVGVPVVLVDDGSAEPLGRYLAASPGLRHLRHEKSLGPAAARNAGARLASTRWIAFVDTDVVPGPDWLGRLSAHLRAPGVVAVAPRVVSAPSGGLTGLVETYSAGLNLGPTAADVGPGSPVSYVPTALLVVARAAFEGVGGFDPELLAGEDVDLVWRLRACGRIRYEPDIVAIHDPQRSLPELLRRRVFYGSSAAQLDRRHPGVLRHVDVSVWSFGPWLLGLAVHPALGVVAGAATVVAAPFTLRQLPRADALRLAAGGQLLATGALGRWLVRPLWPLTLALVALVPGRRRVLVAAVGAGVVDLVCRAVREDLGARPGPAAPVLIGSLVGRTVDDLAYSLGIWQSCLHGRRLAPLYPRVRQLGDLPGTARVRAFAGRHTRGPHGRPATPAR